MGFVRYVIEVRQYWGPWKTSEFGSWLRHSLYCNSDPQINAHSTAQSTACALVLMATKGLKRQLVSDEVLVF